LFFWFLLKINKKNEEGIAFQEIEKKPLLELLPQRQKKATSD
jgi:hypothetical protein